MTTKDTLTTGQIARYCDVNVRTVIGWIDKELLAGYKLPERRGDHRVTSEAFLEFLRDHNMPIPSELQPNTRKILVVDDDINMAKSIVRLLTAEDYDVESVYDGFTAGVTLLSFQPSLITLDLQMPGIDGFDVLKEIKQQKLATKVLVISAGGDEQLERALKEGAHDILAKPFDSTELLAKISQLIS